MLGNFFEYFLSTGSNSGRLAVMGATSGDTGSAAIFGVKKVSIASFSFRMGEFPRFRNGK
jgi:hypothetical protein